ncbi:MAG: hypothetical protein IPO21_04855 [Bacteroidales bacterium]|nr:hypothetical protein [Bacteroidales bacterium]
MAIVVWKTDKPDIAADPVVKYMSKPALEKTIIKNHKEMEKAAKLSILLKLPDLGMRYMRLKITGK